MKLYITKMICAIMILSLSLNACNSGHHDAVDTSKKEPTSNLKLSQLQNNNGLPAGSYIESCKNIQYDGVFLSAQCKNNKHKYVAASLYYKKECNANSKIENNNGSLDCSKRQRALPDGPYLAKCEAIKYDYDRLLLSAKCLNGSATYVCTNSCKKNTIDVDAYGILTCNYAPALYTQVEIPHVVEANVITSRGHNIHHSFLISNKSAKPILIEVLGSSDDLSLNLSQHLYIAPHSNGVVDYTIVTPNEHTVASNFFTNKSNTLKSEPSHIVLRVIDYFSYNLYQTTGHGIVESFIAQVNVWPNFLVRIPNIRPVTPKLKYTGANGEELYENSYVYCEKVLAKISSSRTYVPNQEEVQSCDLSYKNGKYKSNGVALFRWDEPHVVYAQGSGLTGIPIPPTQMGGNGEVPSLEGMLSMLQLVVSVRLDQKNSNLMKIVYNGIVGLLGKVFKYKESPQQVSKSWLDSVYLDLARSILYVHPTGLGLEMLQQGFSVPFQSCIMKISPELLAYHAFNPDIASCLNGGENNRRRMPDAGAAVMMEDYEHSDTVTKVYVVQNVGDRPVKITKAEIDEKVVNYFFNTYTRSNKLKIFSFIPCTAEYCRYKPLVIGAELLPGEFGNLVVQINPNALEIGASSLTGGVFALLVEYTRQSEKGDEMFRLITTPQYEMHNDNN